MDIRFQTSCNQQLINLVGALLDELGEEWNEDDLRASFEASFKMPIFKVAVAWDGGRLVGAIGFYVSPELWNREKHVAHEAFWYVYPTYRGMLGGHLLDFVEKNLECARIDFGISDARLVNYMQRRGYAIKKTILSR